MGRKGRLRTAAAFQEGSKSHGYNGAIHAAGTETIVSLKGVFTAITFLEDSVFDSGNDGLVSETNELYPSSQYTCTDIDADGGDVVDSETFPKGITIYGRWTGFKLASGRVIAYIG
jgi:hypothetical protein